MPFKHVWREALKEHVVPLSEGAQSTSQLTITCRQPDDTLTELLTAIKKAGNGGHSFTIVVDPDADGGEKFYWDGDGGDSIQDIKTEDI